MSLESKAPDTRQGWPAKVRCLVIIPNLARGGAERQAVLVALALREQGLDVRLFVQSGPDSLARDGLIGTLAVDLPPPADSRFEQLVRLRRVVEAFAPDVVITFLRGATLRFGLARAASAAARRAAWIVSERGNLELGHLARGPLAFAAQLGCHRAADRICVNSATLAGNVFTFDPLSAGKLVVLPNILLPFAVDAAAARVKVEALVGGAGPRALVGALGSFQEDRNYLLLAEAFVLVKRARPAAHLLVIGRSTGPRFSAVAAAFQARVDALGLRPHVTVAGEIAGARGLMPGLDVFALSSMLEGSSNALAEAMVAGAATATVPVADARELVESAAVVSAGWTPEALGEAILTALDDAPRLRELAAARGRALLIERSPATVGARWAARIAEAIASAGER